MANIQDFYTRDKANSGARLPLVSPSGDVTNEWIEVYGVDSDAFRQSEAFARREGARINMIKDLAVRDEAVAELTRVLRASMIKDWSFDQPCTPEAALEFIRNAPQVGDAIDSITTNRALFFELASANYSTSQTTNSDSTSSQKAPVKADAKVSSKSKKSPEPAPQS